MATVFPLEWVKIMLEITDEEQQRLVVRGLDYLWRGMGLDHSRISLEPTPEQRKIYRSMFDLLETTLLGDDRPDREELT